MKYSYQVEKVKKSEVKVDDTARQTTQWNAEGDRRSRTRWKRHGILLVLQCRGKVAQFSLSALLFAIM
jgi:hypothetical protein